MNTISSNLQRYPMRLLVVLLLGLIIRLVFISIHQRPVISDEKEYDALANGIATTATFEYNGSPTAYRPVGYPAFISPIYVVVGHHGLAVKYVQAFIDVATGFLLYLLLSGFDERTRILAACLWSFFVPAILYTNLLMSETIYTFLLVLFLLVFVKDSISSSHRFALLGFLLALQILVKPGAAIILLVCPFLFLKLGYPLKKMIPFAIVLLITLVPWLVRNYTTFGQIALTSNGGVNLLIGNNPHSTGAYGISFDEGVLANSEDEFAADRKALHAALGYIAGNPGTFVLNGAKKLARLFESEGGLLVLSFHNNPEDPTTRYSTKYASISPIADVLANLPYFAFVICGVFGFIGVKKEKLWWSVALLVGSWLLLHAIFFGGGRFHFPIMPLAILFSALFLGDVKAVIQRLSPLQRITAILISLILIALWIYEGISIHTV